MKDVDSNTLIIDLSIIVKYSKQSINKDIVTLHNTLDQTDLIDIYRTFQPKEAKYTLFSNAHGTFSKIPHDRT